MTKIKQRKIINKYRQLNFLIEDFGIIPFKKCCVFSILFKWHLVVLSIVIKKNTTLFYSIVLA